MEGAGRGRGRTRRPRLRRSLSAGAVAGPSCPVPRGSPCSPLSVSDPVDSHTDSARYLIVVVLAVTAVIVVIAVATLPGREFPYTLYVVLQLHHVLPSSQISFAPLRLFLFRGPCRVRRSNGSRCVRVLDESRRGATWCYDGPVRSSSLQEDAARPDFLVRGCKFFAVTRARWRMVHGVRGTTTERRSRGCELPTIAAIRFTRN